MTPDRWVDFVLNLFSEAFGILVTVFLIDRILKGREEARWKPSKYLVYSKLLKLTSNLVHIALISPREGFELIMYEFGQIFAGSIPDITNLNLSKRRFKPDLKSLVGEIEVKEVLAAREELLKVKEEFSRVINDSGFFLEPEIISLVLTLDRQLDLVAWQFNQYSDLRPSDPLPSGSPNAIHYQINELYIITQNIQKWLVARSTKRTTMDEFMEQVEKVRAARFGT